MRRLRRRRSQAAAQAQAGETGGGDDRGCAARSAPCRRRECSGATSDPATFDCARRPSLLPT